MSAWLCAPNIGAKGRRNSRPPRQPADLTQKDAEAELADTKAAQPDGESIA
jgi:hypothetical protein